VSDRRHESGAPHGTRNSALGGWLAIALLLGIFAGVSWTFGAQRGGPAPDFTLTSTGYEDGFLGDPFVFSLSDYRGETVVLDFMAVTCTSCRAVTEEVLKPLHARHPDLVILSIDTWSDPGAGNPFGGETDADLIRLQQETDVPWRHARDTDSVYRKYDAWGLPKLAVVDPDGNLVYAKAGSQSLDRVEAAVAAADLGSATPLPSLRLSVLGFAFVAGLACVFTPCGIGLLPAYLALLVEDGARSPAARRVPRALAGGLAAAAGIAAVYGLLALAAWAASDALRAALPWLGPLLGLLLFGLGVAALAGADWSGLVRRLPLRVDGRRGFAAFGVAYGAAGFACTGPLFFPLLLEAFAHGARTGALALLLYTGAVAAVLVAAAGVVAWSGPTVLRPVLRHAAAIHRAGAVVLALGGLYLAWYSAHAYGLL
jgi:cytochrome c biogenesis protein CcdA/thiol-disulfide isomerase/thioredoxin